jgi:methyl-accepting chemotaxis protein
VLAKVGSLAADTQGAAAPASLRVHGELIREVENFVYVVAERSTLLFEPEAGMYLLMENLVLRGLGWTEPISRLQATGAALLSAAATDQGIAAALRVRADDVEQQLAKQKFTFEVLGNYYKTDLGTNSALGATADFIAAMRQSLDSAALAADGKRDTAAFAAASAKALDAIGANQGKLFEQLDGELKSRVERVSRERAVLAVGAAIGAVLLIYLLLAFYRGLIGDLAQMAKALTSMAAGNLRVTADVRGRDEIGDLAALLKKMVRSVSAMAADVGTSAALVSHSGQVLNAGNVELSERTEQQAASLEQTAASLQQLSSTVQQNAETARAVEQQASSVRGVAESGAKSMTAAIDSVEAIQQSAKRMDEIIGVIDGLAFQTNILALNAAVEAARAGEAGRGFAVVASEVRSLAGRSAESAKEIRQLIQTSSSQVADSVLRIRAAGESISAVVAGIRQVAGSISEISTASEQQSSGIKEITTAVGQLDEITQRNAEMVERATMQSRGLEERAATLNRAASAFELAQGVADNAVTLVRRAVAHRATTSRDSYLRELTDPARGFHDRDMYVFALDASGRYLAFGGNPKKVGTRVQDVPGIDGDALIQRIAAQAEVQPGWVEYDITNPTTGVVQTKISFVQKVDDVYVGCGVYKGLAAG